MHEGYTRDVAVYSPPLGWDARRMDTDEPTDDPGWSSEGVPSFDLVRERIEARAATADGATELARETPEGRTLEQQEADRDEKARRRLAELRDGLRPRE